MNLPQPVANSCRNNGYGQTRRATPLGGGSPNSGVNNASRLDTDGGPLFVKLNRNRCIDSTDLRQIDSLVSHLSSLIPPQPASLLHGDLWSGNIHTGPQGEPALIDPATHYGWAEADLAMMTLFGRPPDPFFHAYASASTRPLAPGYRDRFDLYNLYHLLNHLNLFGESYAGSVRVILRRYT